MESDLGLIFFENLIQTAFGTEVGFQSDFYKWFSVFTLTAQIGF